MSRIRNCGAYLAAALTTSVVTSPSLATWSIVIADSETKEVAVGTVTCLDNFDLLAIVPVIVVGKGGAAVQAAGDFASIRRPIIFDHFMLGTDPEEILVLLADISGHQSRQYGISDTQGRMITFTGSSTSQWAGGVIGTQWTMVYAIQGNRPRRCPSSKDHRCWLSPRQTNPPCTSLYLTAAEPEIWSGMLSHKMLFLTAALPSPTQTTSSIAGTTHAPARILP